MPTEQRCIHELLPGQCAEAGCSPVPEGLTAHVHVTGGGRSFHKSTACLALRDGQRYAERMGMNLHDTEQLALRVAQSRGLSPCEVCFSLA